MPKKFKNSMQEVVRSFRLWLGENGHHYRDELENASYLFWGDCEDLGKIKPTQDTEMFFNEWIMMDFSVPGYDNIPVKKRYSFLDCFLKDKENKLSPAGKIFAKNASKSYVGFYRVLKVSKGENTKLLDLFNGREITAWDVNLSKAATEGIIIYGRYSENENEKYIGSGAHGGFLPEPVFQFIHHLITETHEMTNREGIKMSIEEFLKWNSYIYYREIMAFSRSKQ